MALNEAMEALRVGLRASLDKSGLIDHALTKGEFRESEAIAAFRPHLPTRYALSSGIVVNSDGEQSRQQDLLIADSFASPPFLASGGIGVFPVEVIAATLQIKSQIDATSIYDAVENVASLKRLATESQRVGWISHADGGMAVVSTTSKPFAAIFAFAHAGSRDTLFRSYVEAILELPESDRTNALCVLDDFTILWQADEGHAYATDGTKASAAVRVNAGTSSLMLLYIVLMEHLRTYQPPVVRLTDYARSGQHWTRETITLPQIPPTE